MGRMTKEEAMKELCYVVWNEDERWDNLEDFIHNTVGDFSLLEPENSELYLAAITQDKLEDYLEKYWNMAEDAGWIRIFRVCRDCYDVITSQDRSVEDVFSYYYGEESEEIYNKIVSKLSEIESNGEFLKEIHELLSSFSTNRCECCNTSLAGERYFMIFKENKNEV